MDNIPDLQGELWNDIAGFPKYKVSNLGRIKSFRRPKARILKAFINNKGYQRVALTAENKESKRVLVSRIVATAFCEKPFDECDTVDHIDGNKLNNQASNLRWMTSADNTRAYFARQKIQKEKLSNEYN